MNDTATTKMCPHCECDKQLSQFYRCAQYKDGLDSWCKQCRQDRSAMDYASRCRGKKIAPPTKECRICKQVKSSDNFSSRKESRDGLRYYCKQCAVQYDRKHNLKKSFGITPEQYNEMFASQGGTCAICLTPPTVKALAVDHDHTTGHVRGLLCESCNRAIGGLKDSSELLRVAAEYLDAAAVTHLT